MKRRVKIQKGARRTGKFRYRSERDARAVLSRTRRKADSGDDRRTEKRVYECGVCHGFHLTSRPS